MKQAVFTKSLTISIRPESFDLIKEITDVERISISEWFRAAAECYLTISKKEKQNDDE